MPVRLSHLCCSSVGDGRFAFYASVHKENALLNQHPDHKEFHRLCLNATYKSPANSEELLGELADMIEIEKNECSRNVYEAYLYP